MSNLSRINKDEDDKEQINKDIDSNILNLSSLNLNNSKDYYYNNKNYNLGFQKNYINKNIDAQKNNAQYNNRFTTNNNNINSKKYSNNFTLPQNNSEFGDNVDNDNSNNNKKIINQNCFQINIENMSIHNSINNISKNYNINASFDKDNQNNISLQFQNDNDTSNISKISYNSMSLNDLLNNIEKISENQSGCRLLQNKLLQNSDRANDFYKALKSKNILKKMTIDSFGNYLIQKLLEHISNDLISEFFINIICPSFMEISLNPHGSRVIQKLLEQIYNKQNLMSIFNECLQNCMLEIFLNQSSTHIIIKYISLIKYPNNQIIYKYIVDNIYYIATHKHSCCTLQKCLEEGNNDQRKKILMSLANISSELFADQYGNYAIQFALSLKDEEANKIIISKYLSNFQKNISNKISSNVYEKVLEYCDFNTKQYIIKSLCNFETVKKLLYDTYGNYVLQKTLLVSTEPYRSMYIKFIAPLIDNLKNLPNGLIIIHKIVSHFPELQNYVQTNSNKNYNMHYNFNNNMNNNNYNINNNHIFLKNNENNIAFYNNNIGNINNQYNSNRSDNFNYNKNFYYN
mgnify:CR=1 FL=1